MLTVIGLSGKKRAGKDTVCKAISNMSAIPVVRIGFADALKEELARACGVSTQFIEYHKDDFRIGLQWYGTDFKRKFMGDDYWVNVVLHKMFELNNERPLVIVIPDVRFKSEAVTLKQVEAYLVRIERPDAGRITDTHPSETELDNYDSFNYIIHNDSDMSGLEMSVWQMLHFFKLPIKHEQHLYSAGQ